MFKSVKNFCFSESGGAVEWIIVVIAGVIIAALAYVNFKGIPGDLGTAAAGAGNRGADAVDKITE